MADPWIRETGTAADLWPEAVARSPREAAFVVRADGVWRDVGWTEANTSVDELAAGFGALGVRRGDRVALLARTGLEWILVDHALIALGAVVVPIYPTSGFADVAHVLNDSGARMLACDSPAQTRRCLLYTSPSPRDLNPNLGCRLMV